MEKFKTYFEIIVDPDNQDKFLVTKRHMKGMEFTFFKIVHYKEEPYFEECTKGLDAYKAAMLSSVCQIIEEKDGTIARYEYE